MEADGPINNIKYSILLSELRCTRKNTWPDCDPTVDPTVTRLWPDCDLTVTWSFGPYVAVETWRELQKSVIFLRGSFKIGCCCLSACVNSVRISKWFYFFCWDFGLHFCLLNRSKIDPRSLWRVRELPRRTQDQFGNPEETPKNSFSVPKVGPKLIQDDSNASESFPHPDLPWRTDDNFETTPDLKISPSTAGHKSREVTWHWKALSMASLGTPTKAKIQIWWKHFET